MRDMRRTMLSMLLLIGLGGAFLVGPRSSGAAGRVEVNTRGLTVTEVEPIVTTGRSATLSLGLVVRGADSRSAQSDAQAALEKLRQSLRTAGVPQTAVRVVGYRVGTMGGVQPKSESGPYFVMQNIVVQVSSPDRMTQVVDAAIASGAQMVQGGSDVMVLPTAAERQKAVQAAVHDAQVDAMALAGSLGMKLGRVTGVEARLCRGLSASTPYSMRVSVTFGG